MSPPGTARCYDGHGHPCRTPATVRLYAPDGLPVGAMCAKHAGKVIAEYRRKLGETWTARPYPTPCGPRGVA